jgi:hypothetical protein
MKMLFYTNLKFLLCIGFIITLSLNELSAQAQTLVTDESKELLYAEQKNLEQKVNLLLTSIHQRLAIPQVNERYQTVLSEQIYAKANVKCPSIPLRRLLSSNNRFAFNEGMVKEEVHYLAELLQSLYVLINQ